MAAQSVASLPRLVGAAIILLLAWIVARLLRWVVPRALNRRKGHESLRLALARLVSALTIATFALIAATVAVPSFSVGSLIQMLGVSGVVVGFAFKDIFQNFLAGILLLLTDPFEVGDQIVVDAFEGTVEEVQARATLIRTYDRRRVVVPNADLFTKSVIVNTAFPQRRMIYELTVGGEVDPERIKARLGEVLRGIEGVEKDPVADALLTKLSGDNMTFRLLWWARADLAEFAKVQDRVLVAVRGALRADGVKIA
jgi:small conductance mechanosensitive channel